MIFMWEIDHIEELAFLRAFYNVIHTPHGITTVHQNKILDFALQHCLNHRLAESAQIRVRDCIRQFKVLRHLFEDSTFLAKSFEQFNRRIFTDVMYHLTCPSFSISMKACSLVAT